jgi:hypothetical protein
MTANKASVSRRRGGFADVLEKFGILGLFEVLQVAEVCDKVWLVERLLLGQVVEIDGIGKALHKLGEC